MFTASGILTNPHSSANILGNNDPAQVINTSDDSCCLHIVLNPLIYCRTRNSALRADFILPAFLFDKQCYYLPNALERFVIRMRRHAGGYMIISIGYEKYIDWRDDCVTGVNAWVR